MGWKITKDHINRKCGEKTMEGKGYGTIKDRPTVPFRLHDDDGELCFEGIIATDWLEGFADYAFAPLDWAQSDYGCTEMKYKQNGKWETL